MFKKEVERLVLLGFLENPNESKWVSQSFAQPKPYKNQVSFISEFRNSNDQLEYKPYTMPNINEMWLKLEGFQYATSIDLNTGCYNIQHTEDSSNLCKIILPRGN